MEENMNVPMVYIKDGSARTDSLIVAETFKKQHRNVIQAIEKIECSLEFRQLNFKLAKYVDEQGKPRTMYELTRDGFTFLAMGYTGKKAAKFKEAYISTFNRMELMLRRRFGRGETLPGGDDDIAGAAIAKVTGRATMLEASAREAAALEKLFRSYLKLAKAMGFAGKKAAFKASELIRAKIGIDCVEIMKASGAMTLTMANEPDLDGVFEDFFADCLEDEVGARCGASVLYERFLEWLKSIGYRAEISQRMFGHWLSQNYVKKKSNGAFIYYGVRLK